MNAQPPHILRKQFYRKLRSGLCRGLLAVGSFSMITNLLALTVPVFMLQIFDRVISSGNLDTLILLTVMAACALITLAALDIIRNNILIQMGSWIDEQLGCAAMASTISSAASRGKSPSSQTLTDLGLVRKAFRKSAIMPVFDITWTPIFLLIIFVLSPTLGWVALTGLSIILVLALGQDGLKAYLLRKARTASRSDKGQAKTLLRNADSATAMGMVSNLTLAWNTENKQTLGSQARKERADAAFSAIMKFVTQGLRIAMFAIGAMLVVQDSITMGVMIASVLLLGRAVLPVTQIVKAYRSIGEARAAYQRLKSSLARVPEKRYREVFDIPEGALEIIGLRFRYSGSSTSVVRRLNVELKAGEALCVSGPAGSGRSTFAKLCVGILQPRAGQVMLGGVPVNSFVPETQAVHIGYLPPEPQLFHGTIHENIARMRTGTQHSVVAAAQLAGVHDAIIRLPEGYDTTLGNSDALLSRGDTQLIALARAIYGDPRLVVLDEPSAALDVSSEKHLTDIIQTLKNNGTIVVIVSHRSAIKRCCDHTITLPSGKVTMGKMLMKPDLKVIEDGQGRVAVGNSGRNDG